MYERNVIMKKAILLKALGGKDWIGGLYYVKNMAFQLLSNSYIAKHYRIVILTTTESVSLFDDLEGDVKIVKSRFSKGILAAVEKVLVFKANHVKIAFPFEKDMAKVGVKSIAWIPDFQHNHYPQFFTQNDIDSRDKRFSSFADSQFPLVLSSRDCYDDFKQFYHPQNENVSVVHFVSYIASNIQRIVQGKANETLKKYGLDQMRYTCVMNQFWKHKNHLIVLEALKKYYSQNPDSQLKVVFTGMLRKDRDVEYAQKIQDLIDDKDLQNRIIMLGFIDRDEQIAIMMGADFIIQPSLFEGWGTVVEDAKVLDKTILMSNIKVHREQKNEKCILFNPHDAEELAMLLNQEYMKEHFDDVQRGIRDMQERAKAYSAAFEELIKRIEGKVKSR